MDLKSVCAEFVRTFQRSQKNFGTVEFSASVLPVSADVPLNDELRTYFGHVRFSENIHIGGRFNLFLFSPSDLLSAQSGWRWITSKSGEIQEDSVDWKPSWVVIADKDGDAIFVDIYGNEVFGSIQKRNFLVAKSLGDFLYALTEAVKIEMDKYDFEVLDDDAAPLNEFIHDVRTVVSSKLDADATSGFMKFFFG